MIVVIQCAGSKRRHAGSFTTGDGQRVSFVAHPALAPPADDVLYARPDDPSDRRGSWRELLLAYNELPGDNPFKLLPAFELYENDIYRAIATGVGMGNTFILSAGWGLISAGFLTPDYDITFSASAEKFVRRRKGDAYRDFCMLPEGNPEPVLFFGSKEYAPLFAALTQNVTSRKIVFYNSSKPPDAPGCELQRFQTRTRTNWQYECAAAFLAGRLRCAPSPVERD